MSLLRANWTAHNRFAQQLDGRQSPAATFQGSARAAAGHKSRAHEVTAPGGGVPSPRRLCSIVSERYMFFRLISGQAPSMRYFHCVPTSLRGGAAGRPVWRAPVSANLTACLVLTVLMYRACIGVRVALDRSRMPRATGGDQRPGRQHRTSGRRRRLQYRVSSLPPPPGEPQRRLCMCECERARDGRPALLATAAPPGGRGWNQPHHRAVCAWGSVVARQPTRSAQQYAHKARWREPRQSHVFYVLYVGLQFLIVVILRLGFSVARRGQPRPPPSSVAERRRERAGRGPSVAALPAQRAPLSVVFLLLCLQ